MKKNKGLISTGAAVGLIVLTALFIPASVVTGPVLGVQFGKWISYQIMSGKRTEREAWNQEKYETRKKNKARSG